MMPVAKTPMGSSPYLGELLGLDLGATYNAWGYTPCGVRDALCVRPRPGYTVGAANSSLSIDSQSAATTGSTPVRSFR